MSSVHKALDEHDMDIPVIAQFSTDLVMFAEYHLSLRVVF